MKYNKWLLKAIKVWRDYFKNKLKTCYIPNIYHIIDDKSKHMFNSLHGMLEAKVLLKHLYSSSVQYLLDLKQKQIQFETTSNGNFKYFNFIYIKIS